MKPLRRLLVPARFAFRRIGTRPFSVAALSLALAGAAALIGWASIAAARAHEENVRLRVGEVAVAERSFHVSYAIEARGFDWAGPSVRDSLAALGDVTEPSARVRIWHAKEALASGVRFVDAREVALTSGRLPSSVCERSVCETLALAGNFRLGQRVAVDDSVTVRVVGIGSLPPDALPDLSALGRRALLVRLPGRPLARYLRDRASTMVVTAPLDAEAVAGTELRDLHERLRLEMVRLERAGPFDAEAPLRLIDELADRAEVAGSRVLLIAGQAAALIVAFSAFAATARRRETSAVDEQLSTLGASRAQVWSERVVEAFVPAIVGGLVAIVGLYRAAAQLAVGLPFETIAVIVAVMVAAGAILLASVAPRRRARFGVGALELAALVSLALVVWQTAATGGLDPDRLEAGERAEPLLLLLPALASFSTAVLLLRLLPLALRLGERLSRGAPFGVRLAFLTAGRAPTHAAATTTFLALALGAALFGLNYEATLERQARDEAAFAAGASWRVIERAERNVPGVSLGPGSGGGGDVAPSIGPLRGVAFRPASEVTPLTRFRRASDERPTPVLRLGTRLAEPGATGEELAVEVLALPAARVPDLGGWRDSFSSLERAEIARRLRPKPVRLRGPRLAADARALRIWARAETDFPRFAVLHFLRPDQQRFAHVRLGAIPRRWTRLSLELPAALRGAELVGIEFPPAYVPFGSVSDHGSIELGGLEQRRPARWAGLATFEDWGAGRFGGDVYEPDFRGAPIERGLGFAVLGTALALVRPQPPLPEELPALVSGPVAAATAEGSVTLDLLGEEVEVRVAGTAELFPTIVERPSSFLVLDYETLFAALNLDQPGLALPSEAWFFASQRPDFLNRLGKPPFRVESAIGAEALEARLLNDPLAAGARAVLRLAALAAALLGALGLVLATRSALASERTLFAEYEALGVPARTLARSTQVRLLVLSALGIAAGLLGGLLAARLITSLVEVTGTAGRALPPVEPVIAWATGTALLVAVGGGGLLAAALVAGRVLRESAARRLRA